MFRKKVSAALALSIAASIMVSGYALANDCGCGGNGPTRSERVEGSGMQLCSCRELRRNVPNVRDCLQLRLYYSHMCGKNPRPDK